MSAVRKAREYIQSTLPGVDISPLSDLKIIEHIDKTYLGGWTQFRRDETSERPHLTIQSSDWLVEQPESEPTEPTLMQLRAQAQRTLGSRAIRLGVLDEIVAVRIQPDLITVTIKCYEVTESARRWKVTKSGIKLLAWRREEASWSTIEPVICWDEDADSFDLHRYGSIRTPERINDQEDQYENCYRPGTKQSPMRGWAAREGLSHEEVFGKRFK